MINGIDDTTDPITGINKIFDHIIKEFQAEDSRIEDGALEEEKNYILKIVKDLQAEVEACRSSAK